MGNLFDYLSWRGDLTFDRSPFRPVDGLILSALAYVHFGALVPEGPDPPPAGAAAGAGTTCACSGRWRRLPGSPGWDCAARPTGSSPGRRPSSPP